MLDVNKIVDRIGVWHIPVLVMVFARSVALAFHTIFLPFAAPARQDHWCARPENLTEIFSVDEWKKLAIPNAEGHFSRCLSRKFEEHDGKLRFLEETQKCSNWEYDTEYYDWTLVREFGMVCDKSWYVSASQSAAMAGIMCGHMIFARAADRYGRRQALLWATLLVLPTSFATAFCKDFWSFNVMRFGASIAIGALQSVMVSLLVESISVQKRMLTTLFNTSYTVGSLMIPWVAYFIRNWSHQQLLFASISIPMLIVWFFLPESPRWLLASGRIDEAEAALARVVKLNKVENVNVKAMFAEHRRANGLVDGPKADEGGVARPTYFDLIRGPKLRIRTLCLAFLYFASRLLAYHVMLFSARMGGDPFWGFTLVTLMAAPADILSVLGIRFVKRRIAVFVTFFGAGISLVSLIPFGEDYFMTRVVLCTLARLCLTGGIPVLSVFTSESFPTVVRAMGTGSAFTASQLGAMLAPFFKELADVGGEGASAGVTAGIAILGAIAALSLPETFNEPLPDSLADVDPDVGGKDRTESRAHDEERINRC